MSILIRTVTLPKPQGWFWSTDDGGKIEESDLLVCAHCQFTWRFVPGSGRVRGTCKICGGVVCGKPQCMARCDTIEDKIERVDRTRSQQH